MTGGESVDLNELIEQIRSDPISVVGAIIQQVLDQAAPGEGARTPGADVLATPHDITAPTEGDDGLAPPVIGLDQGRLLQTYEGLAHQNSTLAAALGACDCWGEIAECPICNGVGVSGWVVPDARLFAAYVNPAMRAVRHVNRSKKRRHANPKRGNEASKAAMPNVEALSSKRVQPGIGDREHEDSREESSDGTRVAR